MLVTAPDGIISIGVSRSSIKILILFLNAIVLIVKPLILFIPSWSFF